MHLLRCLLLGLFGVWAVIPTSHAMAQSCPVSPAAANAVLRLTETPYASVEDTYLRMQCLEQALRLRDDDRAVFASIYVRTTEEVKRFLDDGAFINGAWARRYTAIFADQYRRAIYDWERGAHHRVASPWRVAFGAAASGQALMAQHLLLGINAHVNYDLANALVEVGLSGDRDAKELDHFLINDILGGIVDDQLRLLTELYAPGLSQLPTPVENLTEDVFMFSMKNGRRHAWERANAMWDGGAIAALWWRALNATEADAMAALILSPALSPQLMQCLRDLEAGP